MFLKAPSYCMDEAKVQNRLIGARWWGGGAGQHCFRMMKDAPAEQLAILTPVHVIRRPFKIELSFIAKTRAC